MKVRALQIRSGFFVRGCSGCDLPNKAFRDCSSEHAARILYAQALTAVRSSGELVSVTSEYAKKRMDMFNKHTKELAEFLRSQLRGETKPK